MKDNIVTFVVVIVAMLVALRLNDWFNRKATAKAPATVAEVPAEPQTIDEYLALKYPGS